MKQLRHVLALTLVFCMVFGMVTPSLAVSGEISVEEDYGIPVEEDSGIEIEVDDRSDYDIDEDREELSVLPKQDETADETNTTGKVDGYNYNIIHLDCGRKYFSVNSIKQIIDNASAAGFNYIQLAVGNDGMRFLLDDMSLEVNGTTYDSGAVTAAIHAGNVAYNATFNGKYDETGTGTSAYYNPSVNELTESDMDEIIEYAYTKGMGVIPLINTPGHMDAILDAAEALDNVSEGTYAYGGSARTIKVTESAVVDFTEAFLNKYIAYFAGKGCTLFNMGADEYANDIYLDYPGMGFGKLQYDGQYGSFVSYVNKIAANIVNAGMTPMAFNDGIYYGGNTSSGEFNKKIIIEYWSNGWGTYNPMSASELAGMKFQMVNTHGDYYWVLGKNAKCTAAQAANFNINQFYGSEVDNPGGSTFCIWSDYPGADTEENVVKDTTATISAFGGTLPTVDSVTNGGTTDTVGETVEITLNVGESTTRTINGVAVTDTIDNDVAKVVAVDASVAGETTYTLADTIVSGNKYCISDGNGNYLSVNSSGAIFNVKISENNPEGSPTEWTIEKSGNSYTIKDETTGYYLCYTNSQLNVSKTSYDRYWDYYQSGFNVTRYGNTYYIRSYNNAMWYLSFSSTNHGLPYTKTTTTAEEKTSVTITGKAPGYTTATVGGVTYNITVNAIEETKSLTVSSGNTAALDVPTLDASIVGITNVTYDVTFGSEYITVNKNDGTITAGTVTDDKTATVVAKIKNASGVVLATYTYNVTITRESLAEVTPITVEYWITNARLTGTTSRENHVTITAQEAFGENGVDISTLVDAMGAKDGRTQEYWQSKILDVQKTNTSTSGTELQTTKEGDDETLNGSAFTKIRYYNSKWQVYTTKWTDVDRTQVSFKYTGDNSTTVTYSGDKNQLVAYYMEVVNINNANNESELHVNAADWGTKGDGTGSWGYTPESNRCSVSVQIVYEDGSTNPSDTTAANLKSKTIMYGYWSGGRGLGTMIFSGQQNYQIYKVTAETGDVTSTTGSGNTVTVTSFDWDKNEETVWEGDATKSVSIGNPARNPSYVAPYDNLAWNTTKYNKNNAILIRVYVKAVASKDSLKVNYVDKGTGTNFYNYNITVAENTVFDNGFALKDGALVNNTVVNYNGITQTVNSNLKEMPEISSYYRFSNFTLEEVKRSADGKEVWLYYTFNNRHDFVVDFGVPLHLDPVDIGLTGGWNTAEINAKNQCDYGIPDLTLGGGLTYTPNKVMRGVETIAVDLSDSNNPNDDPATHFIYLYPATNVLYEENVITNPGTEWTKVTSVFTPAKDVEGNEITTQSAEKLGNENLHGYDDYYSENTKFSGGSAYMAELTLPAGQRNVRTSGELSFTFTGTGFDLISECGKDTGALLVNVYRVNADNTKTLAHGFLVDTYFSGDKTYITGNGILDYQVPVVRDFIKKTENDESVNDYGTYEVTVKGFLFSNSGAVVNSTNAISTYSTQNIVEETLASLGISEEDFGLYEVVYMDDNSILNGGTGAETSVVKSSNVAEFVTDIAMGNVLELNEATDGAKSAKVYVDGIRVYNTIDPSKQPDYKTSEKNTEYYNVYDFVLNSSAGTSDKWDKNSAIYIEKDGNTSLYNIADYKKQGPENEIYLTSGNAVVFALDGYNSQNSTVQVAVKAVSGKPMFNGTTVEHSTELYYELEVGDGHLFTDDKYGAYVILGNDDEGGNSVLSISGLKVSSNIQLIANSELGDKVVSDLNRPTTEGSFEPDTFSASIPKTVKINRRFTVSISASTDVKKVVVKTSNGTLIGEKIQSQANNTGDTLRYSIIATAPNVRGDYTILVYAQNSSGTDSDPIKLTITVK